MRTTDNRPTTPSARLGRRATFESIRHLADTVRRLLAHQPAKRRGRFGQGMEQLEDRVVPAINYFIQTAGGDWNDPSNWNLGRVPTAGDDAVINLTDSFGNRPTVTVTSGGVANDVYCYNPIVVSGGTLATHRLNVVNQYSSLTMLGGAVGATDKVSIQFSTFDYQGGSIVGAVETPGTELQFGTSPLNPLAITLTGGNIAALDGNLPSGITINVIGSTLRTTGAATNAGTIRLTPLNGAASTLRITSGDFTNSATGVIAAEPEAGSQFVEQYIDGGHLINDGTIAVAAGARLTMSAFSTTVQFEQRAGAINLGGYMRVNGGTFDYTGGTIDAVAYQGGTPQHRFILAQVSTNVTATVTAPAELEILGLYSTLRGNLSPTVTLRVVGDSNLSTATGAVNAGTIALDSLDGNASILSTTNGLTNTATGVIVGRVGSGGARKVMGGTLVNRGRVTAEPTVGLEILGTYQADGGWVDGPVRFLSVHLWETTPAAQASILDLRGFTTLHTDHLAGTTLWVNATGGSTTLYSASGFTNNGIILLDSSNGANGTTLQLGTGTLLNATGGVIYANVGTGGTRYITAEVDNRGTINAYGDLQLGKSGTPLVNSGTLAIYGSSVFVHGTSLTNAPDGLIHGAGTITIDSYGPLINNGLVEIVDTAAARLTLQGRFVQSATGTLAVRVLSDGSASTFDQLVATQQTTLAGELKVIRVNGYRPPLGETLPVLTFPQFPALVGAFDSVTGVTQGGRQVLEAFYGPTAVNLVTVLGGVAQDQPQYGSNLGQATITVVGDNFTSDAVVKLVAGATERTATSVLFRDRTTLYATFDLTGLTVGQYEIRVEDNGTVTTLSQPYTVNGGAVGYLETAIVGSPTVRQGRDGLIRVEYVNNGNTDIMAPLIELEATNAVLKLLGEDEFGGSSRTLLAINQNGLAGILSPGAGGSFTFVYNFPATFVGEVDFDLNTIAAADYSDPMDWSSLSASARPADIPQEAWDAVWGNFTAGIGTTVGDYLTVLDENATYLSGLGQYVSDPDLLVQFEFAQANGSLYGEPLTSRYTLGVFGRGGSAPWDVSLRIDPSGDFATVIGGDPGEGNRRLFLEGPGGTFQGLEGDGGVIQLQGGLYLLTERDGSITAFRTDGKLEYLQDANGNRVTAGYNTAGKLTTLTDNSGGSLTIAYNSFGRVETITDDAGRVTTYTYDVSGEHLMQVTTAAGSVSYTYVTGQGAAREHALASVTGPDGVTTTFTYDTRGRLTQTTQTGVTGSVTYTYTGPGAVTVTAPDGTTASYRMLDSGRVGWMRDSLGRDWVTEYDNAGNPVALTGPNGLTSSATFNAFGQMTGGTDIADRSITLGYDATHGWLTSFGDGPNTQTFGYDSHGNLTSLSFATGGALDFDYDPVTGDLLQSTNLRSQAIEYTYNSRGQLTLKEYADGSTVAYTYDSEHRLETVTDASGTTTFTYDTADRVTRVDYPNGRWVGYHYDTAGRRDQLTGPNGYEVNYVYDTAGRIWKLTDSTGTAQVTYSYDPANGRMTRKDLANGTYTTYGYDAAGRLEHLINYAPGGGVNSRFDYTYDALDRVATVTTLDGATTYGYNAAGELTSVELPGGRVIEYEYDEHGNRITVTDNGVGTSYTTNGVSQYTAVGGWTYTYDSDGNLIQKDGPSGEHYTYTYDSENRMTGSTGPDGTFVYEYDAFGNRVATVHNGVRTEYLLDLFGTVDVLAEYDGSGNVSATYTQGLGLVSRSAAGATAFYDFDMLGSTFGLSDATGAYVNEYDYLPFGESTGKTETIDNPFQFVGEYGVTTDGNGLYYMRERFYDPTTGRFVERDPIGLSGGANQYGYVANQPTGAIDPEGTIPLPVAAALIGGSLNATAYLLIAEKPTAAGAIGAFASGAAFGALLSTGGGGFWYAVRAGVGSEVLGYGVTSLISWKAPTPGGTLAAGAQGAVAGALSWAAMAFTAMKLGLRPGFWQENARIVPNLLAPVQRAVSRQFRIDYRQVMRAQRNIVQELDDQPRFFLSIIRREQAAIWKDIYAKAIAQLLSFSVIDQFGALIVRAQDPNDIVGPAGAGPERQVQPTDALPYTIRFENLPTATASAQVVRITQQLDPHLDPRSFAFGEYGWGNRRFQAPAGVTSFRERHDLRDEIGLFVDVEANFDPATGELTWTFTAIDPRTMQIPDAEGFLPVNIADHVGEGFASYTVRARDTVQIGEVIYAQARIVFDTNDPIDTPLIFNTVGPLPTEVTAPARVGDEPTGSAAMTSGPIAPGPTPPAVVSTDSRREIGAPGAMFWLAPGVELVGTQTVPASPRTDEDASTAQVFDDLPGVYVGEPEPVGAISLDGLSAGGTKSLWELMWDGERGTEADRVQLLPLP